MTQTKKRYSELILLQTFKERFEYLKLNGKVGEDTFGWDRYLNQTFYRSAKWRHIRDQVIVRDNGCDMGLEGYPIYGKILIHHINPITADDISHSDEEVLIDLDNLVCVSLATHNAIHYGDESLIPQDPIVRKPGDTCPWLT